MSTRIQCTIILNPFCRREVDQTTLFCRQAHHNDLINSESITIRNHKYLCCCCCCCVWRWLWRELSFHSQFHVCCLFSKEVINSRSDDCSLSSTPTYYSSSSFYSSGTR